MFVDIHISVNEICFLWLYRQMVGARVKVEITLCKVHIYVYLPEICVCTSLCLLLQRKEFHLSLCCKQTSKRTTNCPSQPPTTFSHISFITTPANQVKNIIPTMAPLCWTPFWVHSNLKCNKTPYLACIHSAFPMSLLTCLMQYQGIFTIVHFSCLNHGQMYYIVA